MAAPTPPDHSPMIESSRTASLVRGLLPSSRIQGTFDAPGSKSIAQRVLLAAGLCTGETRVRGLPRAGDVDACLALIDAWGAEIHRVGDGADAVLHVRGRARGRLEPPATVSFGESGTLARFASAVLGLCAPEGREILLSVEGTLARRGSDPLFSALVAAGVEVRPEGTPWPVRIVPSVPPGRFVLEAPVSSQEISGLWTALAAFDWPHTVAVHGSIPSRPYLAITRHVLRRFGAVVAGRPGERGTVEFEVRGPLRAPKGVFEIEADASSAAVALAAACLSGGALEVRGIPGDSPQGDVRIVEHLAAFGCTAHRTEGGLAAHGFPTRGADLDLIGEPDLAPVLAAVAAGAALQHGATSTLRGLGTLPAKESDRLSVLATGLRRLGCGVETDQDLLRILPPEPGTSTAGKEAVLDPEGDHRMAFAFALFGLLRPGIGVQDPGCVAKSWPDFWADMRRLGAEGLE